MDGTPSSFFRSAITMMARYKELQLKTPKAVRRERSTPLLTRVDVVLAAFERIAEGDEQASTATFGQLRAEQVPGASACAPP
jgi:hypothetical protein